MKATSANGVTGFIIRVGDTYMFRVYHEGKPFEPKTFTDYDILHYDLEVRIMDPDAYLYEFDDHTQLDHSPETLGRKYVSKI